MNPRSPRPRRLAAPVAARILLPSLLIALVLAMPARAQVPWRGAFESGWAEAAARARPLWVQFTGPWCVYCLKMDRETFARPDVAAFAAEDVVPVKVRADERPDLMERYGVSRLPATLVLAPDGRLLARRDGYADPGTFLALLASCRLPAPESPRPPAEDPATATLALGGHDPVALAEDRGLAPGRPELVAARDGLAFRFADAANRDAFLADPERYLPRNAGRCLVSQVDGEGERAGDPRFGVAYGGHLYVFASEAARRRFAAEPDRYAAADLAEDGTCPHCRAVAGVAVPGREPYCATYRGRRFLFPDAAHLQAFAAEPDRYVR